MKATAADIKRWASGLESAGRRATRETRAVAFAEALERIDDLRALADALGAAPDARRSDEDNLAFHLVWARVRGAYGVG